MKLNPTLPTWFSLTAPVAYCLAVMLAGCMYYDIHTADVAAYLSGVNAPVTQAMIMPTTHRATDPR